MPSLRSKLKVVGLFLGMALMVFSGCTVAPVRAFKATVPPPISTIKPTVTSEAERQGAQVLSLDPRIPEDAKTTARLLSTSLGAPDVPIVVDPAKPEKAQAKASSNLTKGIRAQSKAKAKAEVVLVKHQGKDIEGTGINATLWGGVTIGILLLILVVASAAARTYLGGFLSFGWGALKALGRILKALIGR